MARRSVVQFVTQGFQRRLEQFRLQLARPDAILSLSLLGLVAGVLAALTIIAFRLLVDYLQVHLLPVQAAEDYESLTPLWRLGAAVTGGLLVGVLFRFTRESSHTVGVLHTLERLAHHQGRLPWRNAVVQFLGGAVTMIAGHSVGREGPSAHLGAASSNLPAQALHLPNNSLRTLAACGAAAGIAASFNTPLAGAAFAMEVLLMEYTVAGFAPVILATVSATAMTRAVFGDDLAYTIPHVTLGTLMELPYILLCGILIGALAGGFNKLLQQVSALGQKLPSWFRPVLAGLLIGLCGMAVPQVMGIGDDTVNRILHHDLGVQLLLVILGVKIIATVAGIGLGLPGGVIGPLLFIGASAGGLLYAVGTILGITDASSFGLYALIGMGAMMAGSMMAPLAGLIAILELTGEPNILLPGMLVVVATTITAGRITGSESVFHGLLRARGLEYRNNPVAQSLRRIGVTSVMNPDVVVLPRYITAAQADEALKKAPKWILLSDEGNADMLLAAVDLLHARKESADEDNYDLLNVPGDRFQTWPVDMGATLQEAQEKMASTGSRMLYVISQTVPGVPRVYGVVSA